MQNMIRKNKYNNYNFRSKYRGYFQKSGKHEYYNVLKMDGNKGIFRIS